MTTNIDNIAVIEDRISPSDQFAIQIDISDWLGTDTISSVAYSATNGNGSDVSTNVVDANKCTNTQTIIKPYIKGYLTGKEYTVKCLVTTSGGDKKAWYVKFECKEFAA